MTYIDHDEGDVTPPRGTYAECSIAWEVTLPGYAHDSGATGECEADVSGVVGEDGEIEDFEAIDCSTGRPVEMPSRVQERAERELIEAAARMP